MVQKMFNAYTPPQNSEVNLDNVTISSQEYLIALNSIVMVHRILNVRGITLNMARKFYVIVHILPLPEA